MKVYNFPGNPETRKQTGFAPIKNSGNFYGIRSCFYPENKKNV